LPDAGLRISSRLRKVALVCSIFLLAAQLLPALAYDEAEYDKAAERVLCDCGCHPQSVAACACGRAAELREEMRAMVAGGMSGDEVIASYVAKHGEKILIAPDAKGFNLVAWLGPLGRLLSGIVGIVLLVRRWGPKAANQTDNEAKAELAPDDPYVSKLRRELEDMQ
jgi:cytochrome c-type biogenesis protein CcmH/NrfF